MTDSDPLKGQLGHVYNPIGWINMVYAETIMNGVA